jgi:molybdenum cofactor guanylyltransferase
VKPKATGTLGIEICVLTGGRSSRMGREKSHLRLGRRSLLGHILATARRSGCPVRVIGCDLVPRCGPIGGIYTALSTTRKEAVLFLPNDMPFVSVNLLLKLKARFTSRMKALFVSAEGKAGFPFLLSREMLPLVERRISDQQFSLQALADEAGARFLRLTGGAAEQLFNVNTPADWIAARHRWRTLRRNP